MVWISTFSSLWVALLFFRSLEPPSIWHLISSYPPCDLVLLLRGLYLSIPYASLFVQKLLDLSTHLTLVHDTSRTRALLQVLQIRRCKYQSIRHTTHIASCSYSDFHLLHALDVPALPLVNIARTKACAVAGSMAFCFVLHT